MTTDSDDWALKLKEEGNTAYKEKRYNKAVELYTKSLEEKRDATVLCNRAQTHLQLRNWIQTVMDCTAALQLQIDNSKAFYRRACALKELGLFSQAKSDLLRCKQIETKNAAVDKLLEEIGDKKDVKVLDIERVERGEELTDGIETQWKRVNIEVVGLPSGSQEDQTKAEEKVVSTQEIVPEPETRPSLPPPPVSFTQFALDFNTLIQYPTLFAQYFLLIDMSRYKVLFDDLIEEAHVKLLLEGLSMLMNHGMIKPASVARCLLLLAKVSRFDIAILFLDQQDKTKLSRICAHFAPQDKSVILQAYGVTDS